MNPQSEKFFFPNGEFIIIYDLTFYNDDPMKIE